MRAPSITIKDGSVQGQDQDRREKKEFSGISFANSKTSWIYNELTCKLSLPESDSQRLRLDAKYQREKCISAAAWLQQWNLAYYCDKIFNNHVGEEAAIKQTVFRAVLTMIPVATCGVTCPAKCHTHSDPPLQVSVQRAQTTDAGTWAKCEDQALPAADAVKLPSIWHCGYMHCACKTKAVSRIWEIACTHTDNMAESAESVGLD